MSTNNKNLHLTNQDRTIIEKAIENGSTKAAIALTLGKDKSNIGKEIKSRRVQIYKSSYNPACANKDECSHNHVCSGCPNFKPSNAIAETNLLVPAMAVPNITIAAMTSLDILPI